MDKIQMLEEMFASCQNIVFFGGAGVSTESGIPDFRSAKGIFMQDSGTEYLPEQIISHSFFEKHPKEFFDFYFDKLIYPEAKPNLVHEFMADLEKKGKNVTVVTQNIDGFHQEAGSTSVLELHGTVKKNYCVECGKQYTLEELVKDEEGIPRCSEDNGIVRPNVVLYGEGLDQTTISLSLGAISRADMLVILGTSLLVQPAASLVDIFQGKNLVIINRTPLLINRSALYFEDSIANVLKQVEIS